MIIIIIIFASSSSSNCSVVTGYYCFNFSIFLLINM